MTHLGTTGFDTTDYQHAIALGRAQATAEIVGWLKALTGAEGMMMPRTIAHQIERGEHIKA